MRKFRLRSFVKVGLVGVALLAARPGEAKMQTRIVEYRHNETTLEGYLAYDDAVQGKRPGVLIVHEWTGLGAYVQKRAEMLAQMGYVAFAADIYGKGVRPQNPQEAGAQAGKYKKDVPLLRQRAQAGLQVLQQQPNVDTAKIAAIGYCFGGTAVLELARSGADVAAVVSFHGGLETPNPADAKNIKGKVLVLHGADDPAVPPDQVFAFTQEMKNANVDWQLIAYGGAVHSFTNPAAGNDNSKGAAYNERADKRSWIDMKQLFDEVLGPVSPALR
ncbi:MAG: hypothetical protein JWN98_678 [Abditibacteriota bacterium]|nr:hypothetical protein [Abditibacteriota bacterium]